MLTRLRYPDWFDIAAHEKAGGMSEDEEKYLELRQELVEFIEPLVKKESFRNYIATFLDSRIT